MDLVSRVHELMAEHPVLIRRPRAVVQHAFGTSRADRRMGTRAEREARPLSANATLYGDSRGPHVLVHLGLGQRPPVRKGGAR